MLLVLSWSTPAHAQLNWLSAPGSCRVAGGNYGSFDEYWGMKEPECQLECGKKADCLGFEFFPNNALQSRCRFYKELLVNAVPGVSGMSCNVKDSVEARASWQGAGSTGAFGHAAGGPMSVSDCPTVDLCAKTLCQAKVQSGGGPLDLQKADLKGCKLVGMDLTGADLSEANFAGANLELAILTGAKAAKANFEEASLKLADLSTANLEFSNLAMADLTEATLVGTLCSRCKLDEALLTKANMEGSTFTLASLNEAMLIEAVLTKSDFHMASLVGTDFTKAVLLGVDFGRADLTGSTFQDAVLDGTTIFEKAKLDKVMYLPLAAPAPPPPPPV